MNFPRPASSHVPAPPPFSSTLLQQISELAMRLRSDSRCSSGRSRLRFLPPRLSIGLRTGLHARLRTGVVAAVLLGMTTLAPPAAASQVEVKILDSYRVLSQGTFENAALTSDGTLRLGRTTRALAKGISGPVLDVVQHKGAFYAAVAAPPRVIRVREGRKPELIVEVDTGLITALISRGDKLVAITAPEGGAVVIDPKTKKIVQTILLPKVKMLLDATVVDGAIWAVGGGDEGILAVLKPGAKKFEVKLRTKEAHLRSVTADRPGKGLVIGGGDDGVIYRFTIGASKEEQLHALYDAGPEETTSVVVDKRGRIFATLVDASGKLSSGATSRAKSKAPPKKKKKSKPRKVKSSEVVRIDPDGAIRVLWQSKTAGAFSLALIDNDKRLLIGTGGDGKVFDLDPEGRNGPAVVARAKGFDEVTVMVPTPRGVVAGTAHGGGVILIENKKATSGTFVSAPLGADTIARWGRLSIDHDSPTGTGLKTSMRTGNTNIPDQTWTAFSPPLIHAGTPLVAAGRYMQVRIEFIGNGKVSPSVRMIRAAYLEVNRPPEVIKIDRVLPGYRVRGKIKDAKSESKSVTFGKDAFKKHLYKGGAPTPKLKDRTGGKQTREAGWRTVFAWAEDPDKDLLRFQWSLGRIGRNGTVAKFKVVKEWSDEPFLSMDFDRLAEGDYRAKVVVDDLSSNGPDRKLSDEMVSGLLQARHGLPVISKGTARPAKRGVRVRFEAKATMPLVGVRCSVGGQDWVPLDSLDGLVDSEEERFESVIEGKADFASVACEATDELGHTTRTPLTVK